MKRFFWMTLLWLPGLLQAQEGAFTVDADFLTRGEYRYGGLAPDHEEDEMDRAAFVLERTRLGVGYERGGFTGRVTAQHSGTWGGSGGSLALREAWVQFTTKPGFFVKLGRQGIAYDDQRIFGNDDWAMTGYSHDIMKAGWEGHGQKVHLLAAYNQNPDNMAGGSYYAGGSQPYKSMQALWYHCDIPSWHLGASAVFMNVGMQGGERGQKNEKTHYQQLAGGFLSFRPERWSVEAAYYHQMGRDEGGLPINAWMASGRVQSAPAAAWKFYAGYDYLSGDPEFPIPGKGQMGVIRHETVRGFNSIFGSHHKFYGAMDFFYVTAYVNGFTPGLQNAYAGCGWTPLPVLSLDASYHFFAAATRIEAGRKPLGHEVEFSASWSFLKDARLSLGCSWMQGTETMEILKRTSGGRRLQWAWLMLSVSPTLFRK